MSTELMQRMGTTTPYIDLVGIPAGQVTLSDRRTERSWTVDLAPFRLGALPVTQEQYAQVTGERPSTARAVSGFPWRPCRGGMPWCSATPSPSRRS